MKNTTKTKEQLLKELEKSNKNIAELEKYETRCEKAKKTIQEREKNFRDLVENLLDGVAIADENGFHIYTNPKFSEITGYSKNELLQMTGWDFTRPEDVAKLKKRMKDRMEGKPVKTHYDRIIVRKDGKEVHVEMSTMTTIWQGKKHPMAVFHDITERGQAEEKLKKIEARQALILKSLPMAFYIAQPYDDYGGMWVSEQIGKISGFTAEQFMNDINLWASRLHPEDKDRVLDEFDKVLERETIDIEYRWQASDGKYLWFLDSGVLIRDEKSKPIEIIGTWLDITKRKWMEEALSKSEDRLSKVMIAVNDGMWDWNLKTNEVYFDSRYYKMLGYGVDQFSHRLEEFQKRVHPGDIENVMTNAEKHLKGEIERFDVEFRFARSDGSWMWILGRGIIVERDDDGNPTRFIGTHTDINKRKQAEAELAKHREHLKELVKKRTAELEEKNKKLTQFNKLFVDREFRIKDLKDKVKELEGKKLEKGE